MKYYVVLVIGYVAVINRGLATLPLRTALPAEEVPSDPHIET
jgi:hypothetical protein